MGCCLGLWQDVGNVATTWSTIIKRIVVGDPLVVLTHAPPCTELGLLDFFYMNGPSEWLVQTII